MYAFTLDRAYLDRARELLDIVIGLIENPPQILWRYVHPKDPETTEAIRKAYAAFPGSGWHIGGFSNQIGYGDCCLIMDRFDGWGDGRQRERARDAGAAICDYRLEATGFFHFDDERRNNRTLTSARGVFRVAEAFSDHPSAARWREWAVRQFTVNLNQPSDEDATGYQSDWFHSRSILHQGADWLQVQSAEASGEHAGLIVNLDPGTVEYRAGGAQPWRGTPHLQPGTGCAALVRDRAHAGLT